MKKLRVYLKNPRFLCFSFFVFASTGEMNRAEKAGNVHIQLSCNSLNKKPEEKRETYVRLNIYCEPKHWAGQAAQCSG